ncbi:hypothetical protein IWQ61_005959 [Dispira simplex]|nr:hypothetical protein IWQ61_005959 [Dispira simplex]
MADANKMKSGKRKHRHPSSEPSHTKPKRQKVPERDAAKTPEPTETQTTPNGITYTVVTSTKHEQLVRAGALVLIKGIYKVTNKQLCEALDSHGVRNVHWFRSKSVPAGNLVCPDRTVANQVWDLIRHGQLGIPKVTARVKSKLEVQNWNKKVVKGQARVQARLEHSTERVSEQATPLIA